MATEKKREGQEGSSQQISTTVEHPEILSTQQSMTKDASIMNHQIYCNCRASVVV